LLGPLSVTVAAVLRAGASRIGAQKAEEERKKEEQKVNDEAYKATIKRTPSSNKKVDPWGSLRTAPGK
jgi:hypothetical protein